MNRFLIISILFFSIISSAYSQESISDINRLSNIISSDSLTSRMLQKKIYFIKERAEMQIRGAGAKEKLATYLKFIDTQSTELVKTFTTVAIPQIYTNHFTPDEIKDLIVFYETPIGKKLVSQMNEIISSLRFGALESHVTDSMEFTSESKKELKVFYKTPTGKKFYNKMNILITEMMTLLSMNYIPDFQQKIKKELQRLDSKIWREAYRVKPEQVTVYEGKFNVNKILVKVLNDTITQETFVTLAVPIYENKFWIRFDKKSEIIDQKSGEHYQALRLDKDLVFTKR